VINVPNLITIGRAFLVPVFIVAIFYSKFREALLVFSVAAVSDALDGFLARKLKQVSRLGVILDPIADKALIDSGYFLLSYSTKEIPVWLTVAVISRDLLILFGGWLISIFGKIERIRPTYLGKATAFMQFLTLFFTLLNLNYGIPSDNILRVMFGTTALLTVTSAVHYSYRGIRELNGA